MNVSAIWERIYFTKNPKSLKSQAVSMALALSLLSAGGVQAEALNLFVAASMSNAFNKIIASFEITHQGTEVRKNFASSGNLAKQIEQGAPADIYVSANPKWMNYLADKKLIDADRHNIFAYNSLVFIGDRTSSANLPLTLKDLVRMDRIAIGNPAYVPAGQYAKQALENYGIYKQLKSERRLIFTKDVRQALIYTERGEVEGAFVYKTDALLATRATILLPVAHNLYDQVVYPVGLTVSANNKDIAKTFYQFLQSPEVKSILEEYGFITDPKQLNSL